METLLAGSVPQLHAQTFVVDVDGLAHEVHAHGRLHKTKGTCSWPVKLSKMKRLIIEVLPTDWSPTSTILHLIGLPSICLLYFKLMIIRTLITNLIVKSIRLSNYTLLTLFLALGHMMHKIALSLPVVTIAPLAFKNIHN